MNQYHIDHINWSVFWVKKGKWVRKRFYDDLSSAMLMYRKKIDKHPILHSDNAGFPPPTRITEHERPSWKIVVRRGKKYKKRVVTVVNLMGEYNDKGIWWCPYCIKLHKFKLTQTDRGPEMYCPVCKISNYDFHTRRANPKAIILEYSKRQQRTSSGKRRRRR